VSRALNRFELFNKKLESLLNRCNGDRSGWQAVQLLTGRQASPPPAVCIAPAAGPAGRAAGRESPGERWVPPALQAHIPPHRAPAKGPAPPSFPQTRTMPLLVVFFLFCFHRGVLGQAVGDAASYSMHNSIDCAGDAVYVWNIMPVCMAELWRVGSYDVLCNSSGVYSRHFATSDCSGVVAAVTISGYTSCTNAYQSGLPSSFARMSVQWRCGLSSLTSTTGAFSVSHYKAQARGDGGGSGACEKTELRAVTYRRADTCDLGSRGRFKYFNETHAQVLRFAPDDDECIGPANQSFLAYGCSFIHLGVSNDPNPFFEGSVAAWIPAVSAAVAGTRPPWELLSLISLIGIPALYFLCKCTLARAGWAKTAPAAGPAISAQPHPEKA
jgi:hypothetical protein